MTCLGFIWHYFNVKLHIFFSVCLLLELQSVSIHQFVQIPNTSVTIKSLISLKTVASNIPTVLSLDNGNTVTNPYDIANTFNNYFASIAETTKKNVKYLHKHFSDYLSNENSSTIFLQPTDKEEIANFMSSLNSNKASGPNSIPYRILFLLKNEISKQLADLFNLSFMTGVFPSVLKTAKVVCVFKKDSKLDYSNYRPISLLSNVEKILEKIMYKREYTFLNKNSIIYNLQFGFRQQYSTSHALINITENIKKALDGGNILLILSTTRYKIESLWDSWSCK